ncbi:MAG: PKD domain-containing protein, partial [Candidatus Electrothrix sp. AUS3]|nr:PKD domain-containing protein [Candidatus Electrothrix gigas]
MPWQYRMMRKDTAAMNSLSPLCGCARRVILYFRTMQSRKKLSPVFPHLTLNSSSTQYSWDFGDSLKGQGSTATHSYTRAGTYTVRLTAQQPD